VQEWCKQTVFGDTNFAPEGDRLTRPLRYGPAFTYLIAGLELLHIDISGVIMLAVAWMLAGRRS